MIAKNIKGKSFKGCVSYVMHEGATLLEAEGVWAATKQDIIRSFAMQRSGRKEIKQPVGHIPIAFSPEDKERTTDEFMIEIAKEYMREMGISNTQYIIVRHHNTENPHLHIVYNRINNDLKLISVNHDYKRNIKVCKKLKDKYKLTYGEGKENVKREKLNDPDKIKYYIHDAIKSVLPSCKNPADLRFSLQKFGIEIDYKWKRTVKEIEGVSFRYGTIAFKGSQVDRKFSFGNLKKQFEKNIEELKKQGREESLRELAEQEAQKEVAMKTTPTKQNFVIKGVGLNDRQQKELVNGGHIFLENMTSKNGATKFSAYAFLNDEKSRVFFSDKNPDEFIKHGKYEMRIRDKILVENGHLTKAKVKWHGYGNYANPYLWKTNKSDVEYQESWDDPRLPKSQKSEQKQIQPNIPKNNRGRKM
jgi:Relaxase/Mobilisation nuclease domain.